jgi:hypothetical protein
MGYIVPTPTKIKFARRLLDEIHLVVSKENHAAGTTFPLLVRSNKAENKTATNTCTRIAKLVLTDF